ncbi:MAG: hypothetical protein AAF265_05070 [Pseudomonadota bacterium]
MPIVTIVFAAALIALGVMSWVVAGQSSVTALIPAFFGVPLGVAGFAAMRESWRKYAMHVAATIGLLGAIGALSRAIPALESSDGPIKLSTASQLAMGIGLLVFVGLCVRSFIAARKAQSVTD